MSRVSASRIWTVLSSLFAVAIASNSASAQSRALFSDQRMTLSSASADVRSADPAVLRSRRATADVSLLAESSRASSGGGLDGAQVGARSVDLNLFTNVDLVAHLERIEVVDSLGFAWVGQVSGVDDSTVVLAVSDGVLTGSITMPGRTYSVRQVGASYEIAEINTQTIPGDDLALPPVADASTSRVVSRAESGWASADSGDFIDLLICYTAKARQAAGGAAAVNSLATASVAQVNSLYAASGVSTRIRLVGVIETALAESGSAATDLGVAHADAGVRAARDAYGADIVSVLVSSDPSSSGSGYVSVSRGQSFSDLGYNVTVYYPFLGYIYSLAHEIGHNQGALHEAGNNSGDDTRGAYPYSLGYTDIGHGFYDVMSYGRGCSNCTRLSQFSSSVARYQGNPVGSAAQDAARTINNTRAIVANYRSAGSQTPQPPGSLAANTVGSSVSLTWAAPSGAVTSYVIEAGSAPGLADLANFSTGSTATSFSATGVGNGTYYVRVKAANAAGTSGASNEVTLVVR
jgi:peptidyl-Asp metalloendopeptidase